MEQTPDNPKPKNSRKKPTQTPNGGSGNQQRSAKLRGLPKDSPQVRISKTLSWILRHGAQQEGLAMLPNGYVKVVDLLANPKLQSLNLDALLDIVKSDSKQRYDLMFEAATETWWIKANQGHSIKTVKLELHPIMTSSDIPSGIAVHGTTALAWKTISTQGLSKMSRNHIHLAQGIAGDKVISGMRKASEIFIFVDVQKALDAGLKFFLSANGVVLTEGDERGYLDPQFFKRVENAKGVVLLGSEIPSSPSLEKGDSALVQTLQATHLA